MKNPWKSHIETTKLPTVASFLSPKKRPKYPSQFDSKLHRNLAFVPALVDVSEPKRPELLVSFWANLPQLWAEKLSFWCMSEHALDLHWSHHLKWLLHYHKTWRTQPKKTMKNPLNRHKWIQMVINILQGLVWFKISKPRNGTSDVIVTWRQLGQNSTFRK